MKQTRWGKLTQFFKQPLRQVYQRLQFYNGNNYQFSTFSGNAYDSDPVRSAIDAIARNGAKLTPRHIRKIAGGITIPSSTIIEDLLQLRPNPYMNAYSFFYKVITQKFLRNNAFIYVDRPDGLTVKGLYPVVPTGVEFLESAGDLYMKFYFKNGVHTVLPYDDIIHLRRFYADNDLLGEQSQAFTSKLQAIQTADEGIAHAIETTANLKGIMKFNQMLKGDDMKAYKDKFVADYLDINENGSGIAAMDSRADYVELKQDPKIIDKAQADYLKQAVYEYYGVNEAIITSNYNEDQWNAFYEGVLEPIALEMGTEFTSKIFSGKQRGHGNRIFFEANRLQYASNQTKVNLVKEAAPYGVLSRNEIREIFNMAPLDEDKRFQTLNVVDDEVARDYQMTKGAKRMPTKPNKEIRMAAVSVVQDTANDERIVEGRAIVFGAPTVLYEFDGIQYKEVIERGALDGADLSDVPFKYNHSDHVMIMARTRNQTLELTVDDQGLMIRAKLADTSAGRDMYELVKRSDITEMSFAFTVTEASYNKETHTRKISKIKRIWDVAAVDTPAYQDTYIKARSFFEAEAEKEQRAAEAANRAWILTKIKIMTMEE